MKTILTAIVLSLSLNTLASDTKLFICEGKIDSQDITILDDGLGIGIFKGKLNISAGHLGNNLPLALFENNEIEFKENGANCELIASKGAAEKFVLKAPCDNPATAILEVDVSSLGLKAEGVTVACRLEEYSRGSNN